VDFREIEFQLLQAVTNTLGDERVTLGLVHWDGEVLRSAWRGRLPRRVPAAGDVRQVLRGIRAEARRRARAAVPGRRLAEVHPVLVGRGSALEWRPERCGRTQQPAAHFEAMAGELGLVVAP
jgi:hypothetical protein